LFRGIFSKNILCTNRCLFFFGTKHGKISPRKSPNFEFKKKQPKTCLQSKTSCI
jgi:hypothetical protein